MRKAWRIGLVFAACAVTQAAGARPLELAGKDWEGCADFVEIARAELGSARVAIPAKLDLHALRPEDGVLVIHPERSLDVESLARFMRAGGRVVLLDDFGSGDGLLRAFGIERTPMPARPAELLRQNAQFAIAEPASGHPAVADVQRVVLNHASGLRHPNLSIVLTVRGRGEADVAVAVAGAVGQGRLLAVGDSSVVMNSMLRYQGNAAFARGLVRYAMGDDTWGKRGGTLYVVAGAFETGGSFGSDPGGLDSFLPEKVRALTDGVAAVKREGFPATILFGMAVTLGAGILLWVALRASRTHRPSTPRFARGIPLVAQGGLAGHAAVLAAPETTRVLQLLELKRALEEGLSTALGLDDLPGTQKLLEKIKASGVLSATELTNLRQLLLRLAEAETLLMSAQASGHLGGHGNLREGEVLEVGKAIRDVLDKFAPRDARPGAPS